MKKLMFFFVIALTVLLVPMSSFAVPANDYYNLYRGQYKGFECTTAYKYIILTVTNDQGYPDVYFRKLVNGSWVTQNHTVYGPGGESSYKYLAGGASQQWQVLVDAADTTHTTGYVACKGSNQ